jgi:4'-phosphopantetheinyl transferase
MTQAGDPTCKSMLPALASELHVWLASPGEISDPAVLDGYEHMLSAHEQSRCRKLHFSQDRRLFLVSHALVRRALSHYADVQPSAWEFSVGAHGKPEISAPALPVRLRFSLSHTPGLAACLVSLDDACGADVERRSRQCDMQAIARRMFAPGELSDLGQLAGEQYRERFFVLWTLREAWSKARGHGLAHVPRGIQFDCQQDGSYVFRDAAGDGRQEDWQLSVQFPTAEHVLAVAACARRHPHRQIITRWITP